MRRHGFLVLGLTILGALGSTRGTLAQQTPESSSREQSRPPSLDRLEALERRFEEQQKLLEALTEAKELEEGSDGKLLERQGLACDLAGFGEQFVSLGRNTLGYEADNAPANAANAPISASAGTDR